MRYYGRRGAATLAQPRLVLSPRPTRCRLLGHLLLALVGRVAHFAQTVLELAVALVILQRRLQVVVTASGTVFGGARIHRGGRHYFVASRLVSCPISSTDSDNVAQFHAHHTSSMILWGRAAAAEAEWS